MENKEKRVVLCGANAYEQKYYFNEENKESKLFRVFPKKKFR